MHSSVLEQENTNQRKHIHVRPSTRKGTFTMKKQIKTGDLVKVATRDGHIGMVTNTWRNHLNRLQGVDVLLENGEIKHVGVHACRVLSESR